jgi:hypothetical protein
MIMRPAWRSRTTPGKRAAGIGATFALLLVGGVAVMWLVVLALRAVGAPGAVTAAPWWLPTLGALGWAMRRPKPGEVTEDGDDSWLMLSVRAVMVGIDEPRARPLRVITAVLFGAPVAWGLVLVGALILAGIL